MHFKIDRASLIVGRKFTVFALFYFVFEGNFQVQAPGGAYIWRGNLMADFLRCEFGGLILGGAYTWWGFFSEFYHILFQEISIYWSPMNAKTSDFYSLFHLIFLFLTTVNHSYP